MELLEELQQELASEYEITKKFIAHYPEELNDWRPHEKSGTMLWLAIHVVEIFAWPYAIMNTPYLDFAVTPYAQPPLKTRQELRQKLDADYQLGAETLAALKPEELDGSWDVRQGDTVFMKWSKYGAIRHAFQQITHHRAQRGVYYRLNNVYVPASYGPSADER